MNAPQGYLDITLVGTTGRIEIHCTSTDTLEPGSPDSFDCPSAAAPDGGITGIEVAVRHDAGF